MGQTESTSKYGDKAKPLVLQRHFEATIHRRFVRERVVTVDLEDGFWTRARTHEYEIKDLHTNQVLFRLAPNAAGVQENQRQLLLDAFRVPVLGMVWENRKPTLGFYKVIPGGTTATHELFTFTTQFNPFEYPLELIIPTADPKDRVKVCVIGKWRARRCVIGIQRGDEGHFYKIGEINTVGSITEGKYRIHIAPGVDIALVVLFAAAMDEQSRLHETGSDRAALKSEIKKERRMQSTTLQQLHTVAVATQPPPQRLQQQPVAN